jgi:hypothetical protein
MGHCLGHCAGTPLDLGCYTNPVFYQARLLPTAKERVQREADDAVKGLKRVTGLSQAGAGCLKLRLDLWTVTSSLRTLDRLSLLVFLSRKRRDRCVRSRRARGKTEVKVIVLRDKGVAFKDAWSAAAVSQSALGGVQRQHHFRPGFQFKRMPG